MSSSNDMNTCMDTDTGDEDSPIVIPSQLGQIIHRFEVLYACTFPIEPEELNHYYCPPPTMFRNGLPVLQGSPEMTGPLNTKWQVTMTCNRWIGTGRWVSIYLTRTDSYYTADTLFVCCEFRIVDKDGNVLKSRRSLLNSTTGGTTRGFTQFLPFSQLKSVLSCGNLLMIEAHLKILSAVAPLVSDIGGPYKHDPGSCCVDPKKKDISENLLKPTSGETSLPKEPQPKTIKGPVMPSFVYLVGDDDRVEARLNEEFVAFVSRKKLQEKSKTYNESLANQTPNSWNVFHLTSNENGCPSISTVGQCVQYLHEDNCEYLVSGTYEQVLDLLVCAEVSIGLESLLSDCLDAMNGLVGCKEAAFHAILLREKAGLMDATALKQFRQFFRKNFFEIRKNETFNSLIQDGDNAEYFTRLLVDPCFVFVC